MNSKIQDSLKQQVLSLERNTIQNKEHHQKLNAVCESLAESTDVPYSDTEAVLKNLQEEQAIRSKKLLPISIPALKPAHTRIVMYLIAGFLAFSAYKSAQINDVQQELAYDSRTNNFKVTFNNEVALFKSLLGDAQLDYHKQYGDFPTTLDDLNLQYDRTTAALASYNFVDDYYLLDDGSVKIRLTESYGYNRWLKLTPEIKPGAWSDQIEQHCSSNAERELLQFHHNPWCEHSG